VPVDAETRVGTADHQALRLWLRLLACTRLVELPLRRRLRTHFDSSLPRFDLMAQLARHPGGLQMRELSKRLMVTGGNVTGLTDRLVVEGMVERQDVAGDGRACTVALTAQGHTQFRHMARAHEMWVAELLSGLEAGQLDPMLVRGRLKTALAAHDGL
jgi:DNA-binding MarR family transcriptional regulator